MTAFRRKKTLGLLGGTALLAATALLLGACSSPDPTPVKTSAATSTPSEEPTPTPTVVPTFPLTGLPDAAGAGTVTSIASKIDNHIQARPQVGLQHADIIYEELVEGGITRYVAVWQSDLPKLYGPVRSIRGMDPDIVSPLGGIITYSGGQPIFVNGMEKTVVKNVVYDKIGGADDIFYRTKDKRAPHNVIVKAENLMKKYGSGIAAPTGVLTFSDDVATATASVSGTPASKFRATFSQAASSLWEWDAAKGVWLRSQGTPSNSIVDKDDEGNQRQAVNVAIAEVTTKVISHTPVTQIIGEGEGWVFSNGKSVHATWKKADRKAALKWFDDAGAEITFAPGNTWVELVPNTGKVTIVP